MVPFKKGEEVKQVVKVISGPVLDVRYSADDSEFSYLVGFSDAEGDPSERWFKHSEVEAV